MSQTHLLRAKAIDIDERRIATDPVAKRFLKLVYSHKLFKKVYTVFEGFDSEKSRYISLTEFLDKVPDKTIRSYFITNFTYNSNPVDIVPIITSTGILKLYCRFNSDVYDFTKIADYVKGQMFYGFGENGFMITYRSKTYNVFICD